MLAAADRNSISKPRSEIGASTRHIFTSTRLLLLLKLLLRTDPRMSNIMVHSCVLVILLAYSGKWIVMGSEFILLESRVNLNSLFIITHTFKLQGDPNQSLLIQMATTLKICISDPMLIKPKCVLDASIYFWKLACKGGLRPPFFWTGL